MRISLKAKTFHISPDNQGFMLPTILIIAGALLILGLTTTQVVISTRDSLNDQYYTNVAREAAEAGAIYAIDCYKQTHTSWTTITPDQTCTGGTEGSAYIVNQNRVRSTFSVASPITLSNSRVSLVSTGTAYQLSQDGSTVVRTYSQTIKRTINSNISVYSKSMGVSNGSVYVLGSDNIVYAVGNNDKGQLGVGDTQDKSTPVKVPFPASAPLGTYVTSVFVRHVGSGTNVMKDVIILGSDGQIYVAGENDQGQLGQGDTTDRSSLVQFPVPGNVSFTYSDSGSHSICALTTDGDIWCAGDNHYGQLSDNTYANNRTSPVLFQMPGGMHASYFVNEDHSNWVIGVDGNLYVCGQNSNGQLGLGNTTDIKLAVKVPGLPAGAKVIKVMVDSDTAAVLLDNGEVWGMGRNLSGQLGVGDTNRRSSPVKVSPAGMSVKDMINVDGVISLVTSDSQIYSAGKNNSGQLGIGNFVDPQTSMTKMKLPSGVTYYKEIDRFEETAILTGSDDLAYAVGNNTNGQLGDGTYINRNIPVLVNPPAGIAAKRVMSDGSTNYILSIDDNVYAVGDNEYGQLANGTTGGNSVSLIKFPFSSGVNGEPYSNSIRF
jgi:alpha-tubulin suppressor-like RCC1 family protein